MLRYLQRFVLVVAAVLSTQLAAAEIAPIQRVLPPEGIEIPAEVRERLEARLAGTKKRLEALRSSPHHADIEVFTKAVELALQLREFYVPKDFAKADWALDEADKRLDSRAESQSPWLTATGTVVQGYYSSIDGSAQPYGLVIPQDHDFEQPCPLYVWLHGRGDKNTDLHFLQERATKPGQVTPKGAIVLHPFGRHCVGWKHAGEIDVLEAIAEVQKRYKIIPNRIVLIGFSMGGAGAWHIGAHYADRWIAVSPGAGFAETARYQRLTPDKYPPEYEQTLWGLYDVPGYVRNLFNTRVIAYSGELDKQIQAARVMEEAYQAEGHKLEHLIGPDVEHKYEPKTLAALMQQIEAVAMKARPQPPKTVHLQTRTTRYGSMHWVRALRLEEHWADARIDGEVVDPKQVRLTTKNVSALGVSLPFDMRGLTVNIDGTKLTAEFNPNLAMGPANFLKVDGIWQPDTTVTFQLNGLAKGVNLQGPIDDAFVDQFLVVVPSGKSKNSAFQAWVDFELNHFVSRWRSLMRGDPPIIRDVELNDEARARTNLILWGDPDSNIVMRRLLQQTPVRFEASRWQFGGQSFDGGQFVPALIYPRLHEEGGLSGHYLVLNSGLTFREGHDRTNSLQNPKLPDWAIIDISRPPDAFAPGRIHDAGFFDEAWQLKGSVKGPTP